MAMGDKRPVVMEADRAVAGGIATLGSDGKLTDAQIPGLDKLGAAPAPLGTNKTLYVATTGNDTTGDGSSTNPYATIQKAIDILPKDLGSCYVTINVAAGEYAGFSVAAFSGGYQNRPGISIVGESRDTTVITGEIKVTACSSYILINHLHITGNSNGYNVSCLVNRFFKMANCQLDGTTAPGGVWIVGTSTASLYGNIISDKTASAITVDESTAFINYTSGSDNAVGITVGSSGSGMSALAILYNFTLTATTTQVKAKGGIIISNDAFV